jgi:hypothetical protein
VRIIAALIVALALFLQAPPGPPVAAAAVSLEVVLDRSSVRLGDPVALQLVVTHPAQTKLAFPDVAALQSTGLEVLRVLPGQDPRPFAENLTTVLEYTVVGFSPQVYVLPPAVLSVAYETQDGQQGTVQPPGPLVLTVESVLADLADPSLRGIRPPVALAEPLLSRVNPASAAALAAAAILLLLIYIQSRRRRALIEITPEQRAREALQAAAALLSASSPDYVLFYTQVATVTRKYLAERTDLPALTSTTRELQRYVGRNGTDSDQAAFIIQVLSACDAARWAHEYSGLAGARETLALAFRLIDSVAGNSGDGEVAMGGSLSREEALA